MNQLMPEALKDPFYNAGMNGTEKSRNIKYTLLRITLLLR